MGNELEKALENKFFCPSRFAHEIETLVLNDEKMSYIDAIIHFCEQNSICLLYTSPSPRDRQKSRMPSSA